MNAPIVVGVDANDLVSELGECGPHGRAEPPEADHRKAALSHSPPSSHPIEILPSG